MSNLSVQSSPAVKSKFDSYPPNVHPKMEKLRSLVLKAAEELPEINNLEETLKWGEPSFKTKYGSTIRMDWKEKSPEQYAIYFQCTSQLVPTFKAVFKDTFQYEGTRAIVFDLNDKLPEEALKSCFKAGLMYHKVKHLPMLGM
ncbi:MAG: DUF1801 domain-containing protein [Saprospiraceae bacterium]